jgi:hypothetical protein
MVWYGPAIASKPPASLPTMRHFEDMGIVSSRSDWSGDESLLAFKSGPGLGHYAMSKLDYSPGGGHMHPDANHFVLFGAGEWLIRDDGYRFKGSVNHNTLLVNGHGQMGENSEGNASHNVYGAAVPPGMWFAAINEIRAKANPHITAAISRPEFDYMAGDATEAYPKELGLRRFVRQIVFVKPDIAIVADDVETDDAEDVELRFHPQFAAEPDGGGVYVSKGKTSVLRFQTFAADGVEVHAAPMPARTMLTPAKVEGLDKLEDPNKLYTIQLKTQRTHWRNVAVLSWSPRDREPLHVDARADEKGWTFHAGGREIRVKWDGTMPEMAVRR